MNIKADFEKKIQCFIEQNGLITDGDKVVVALSGGADSVCLLTVLCSFAPKLSLSLYAAHVNHMLRGDDADADESFCRKLCERLGVELRLLKCDVADEARRSKESVEAAARRIRYAYFAELMNELGASKLATAHNKNDNAETSLMHYIRGSGLDGLRGIVPKRADGIVRPLLCVKRDEIEAYLAEIGQEYVTDTTNFCDIYSRNKLRLKLLPQLAEEYNPQIINALADNAQLIAYDAEYINRQSRNEYERLACEYVNGVYIDAAEYEMLDKAISLRVIKFAIAYVKGSDKDISYDTVMRCAELFASSEHKAVSISAELVARREYDRIYFERYSRGEVQYCYEAVLDEDIYIQEADVTFRLTVTDTVQKEENCEYFDYNLCDGQIYIRSRKNGDRFVPYGMTGKKKLKDFFIDEKLRAEQRARVPIVVCGEELLWISGVRRSNLYKVSKETKNILKIKFWRGR